MTFGRRRPKAGCGSSKPLRSVLVRARQQAFLDSSVRRRHRARWQNRQKRRIRSPGDSVCSGDSVEADRRCRRLLLHLRDDRAVAVGTCSTLVVIPWGEIRSSPGGDRRIGRCRRCRRCASGRGPVSSGSQRPRRPTRPKTVATFTSTSSGSGTRAVCPYKPVHGTQSLEILAA